MRGHHQLLMRKKQASPSRYLLAAHGSSPRVTEWDVETWEKQDFITPGTGTAYAACYTNDNRYIIYALDSNPRLRVYDRITDQEVASFNIPSNVAQIYMSPRGDYAGIANAGVPRVHLLKIGDWELIDTLQTPTSNGQDCCITPDGNTFIAAHFSWAATSHPTGVRCNVTFYNISNKQVFAGIGSFPNDSSNHCYGVTVSPDGVRVAISQAMQPRFRVFNVSDRSLIYEAEDESGQAIKYSPNNLWLAKSTGNTVRVMRADTHETIHTFPEAESTVYDIAFSNDSKYIAYCNLGTSAPRVRVATTGDWQIISNSSITVPGPCRRINFSRV